MFNNNQNPFNQPFGRQSLPSGTQTVQKQADFGSILMALKIQNYQNEMYKSQLLQLIGARNNMIQGVFPNLNQPPALMMPTQPQIISPPQIQLHQTHTTHSTISQCLRLQIREIIEFLIENYGLLSDKEIEKEKYKHANNKFMVELFDILVAKYTSTTKTKEEMVKYTLRKVFKFIKNSIKSEMNVDSKAASSNLCKRYFSQSHSSFSEFESKMEDEEEFIKLLMPFRKNSKNKTMNNNFISEIFTSDQFCSDYQKYLDSFDSILAEDNSKKIDKLIAYVEDCISRDAMNDMKKYKRIPWLKIWNENTRKLAQTLLEEKYLTGQNKKIKPNSTESTTEETNIKFEDNKINKN